MNPTSRQSEYETFSPSTYLREYYLEVGAENQFLIDMFAHIYKEPLIRESAILEVGGGPTIYQLVSASKNAKEIHFTDFAEANLEEVKKWLENSPTAFNWDIFVAASLKAELLDSGSEAIEARKKLLRDKVTKISRYDVLNDELLDTDRDTYDVVSSIFSTDAISHSVEEWKHTLNNLSRHLKPGGLLILVGVLGSNAWVMGDARYKATNLSEAIVQDTIKELGFSQEVFETTPAEESSEHGYDAVFFLTARKQV